jgi:hypothetical protein
MLYELNVCAPNDEKFTPLTALTKLTLRAKIVSRGAGGEFAKTTDMPSSDLSWSLLGKMIEQGCLWRFRYIVRPSIASSRRTEWQSHGLGIHSTASPMIRLK